MGLLKKVQKRIDTLSIYRKYGIIHPFLRVEACSFCQLDCVRCPSKHSGGRDFIGSGYLRFEHFKQLVDNNPAIRRIELSNFGEIFLNPDIDEIMRYAFENDVMLFSENGSNLNTMKDETLESLCKYQFRSIAVSIDGACQETYIAYRRKGDFDTIIENIKKINSFKKKYNTEFPKLIWCYIVFGHNEHEIQKAKEMAKSLSMEFSAKMNSQPDYSPVKDLEAAAKEIGYASREDYIAKNDAVYCSFLCQQFWDGPQVNWDGKLLGCCINKWKDFGNIYETSLEECLNSPKYQQVIKVVTGKVKPTEDLPCFYCHVYKDMKEANIYVKQSPKSKLFRKLLELPSK